MRLSKEMQSTLLLYLGLASYGGMLFIFNAAAARSLQPAAFGAFSLVQSIVYFCVYPMDLGASFAGARVLNRIHSSPERARSFFGVMTLLLLAFSLAAFVCLCAALSLFTHLDKLHIGGIVAIAAVACTYHAQIYLPNLLKGGGFVRHSALFFLGVSLATFAAVVILFYSSRSAEAWAIGFYAPTALSAVAILISLRPAKHEWAETIRDLGDEAKRYGFRIYLSSMLAQLAGYGITLVIGVWASSEEAGYINLTQALSNVIFLLPFAYGQVQFAGFANAKSVDRTSVFRVLALTGGLVLLLTLLKDFFVGLVFGAAYGKVAALLPIALLAVLFKGAYQPYLLFLHSHGETRLFWLEVGSAAFTVAATCVLVGFFGVTGGVWSMVAANAFYFAAICVLYRKHQAETCAA